ncbi:MULTISPECIES: phosphatidylglycerophosphatase A family protein [Limosilactobacillus]|jgi:phosphatidylglycerophosphatase A|uniref:phosphatidylglycerophosphatase A family protein n=1 Tax=Limosilactobacillus TaxID=2742598 RepID=UPI0022641306|nr:MULTISPECIES: phosphatidylglycerophosphatase A [Limosilactobacillus]MCH3921736.1 phosphatidylglycerophosphatase A [Limosilactobacillus sp.]MCH3928507.1 phosphatidylglycerophosphatase A [Limosilactobacillus sp.]
MNNPQFKYPDTKAYEFVVNRLQERGVQLSDLVDIIYQSQKAFEPTLTVERCQEYLTDALHKRELLNNAMVMLELDRLTEAGQVAEPLSSIIKNDVGVFGVDETLALQIANIYGTIGTTNFGYFDRVKKGIIARYDTADNHVNTFIDDLLAAIVAAVCGKIAHQYA